MLQPFWHVNIPNQWHSIKSFDWLWIYCIHKNITTFPWKRKLCHNSNLYDGKNATKNYKLAQVKVMCWEVNPYCVQSQKAEWKGQQLMEADWYDDRLDEEQRHRIWTYKENSSWQRRLVSLSIGGLDLPEKAQHTRRRYNIKTMYRKWPISTNSYHPGCVQQRLMFSLCLDVRMSVPLSCANKDSSAVRAQVWARPIHTCRSGSIIWPRATLSSLVFAVFVIFCQN